MGKAASIELSDQERLLLTKHVNSPSTSLRLIKRSKIILLASEGKTNKEISVATGIEVHNIGRWRNRWVSCGYEGIVMDAPRGLNHGGKQTADQAKLREEILRKTTQEKPEGATHWSTRSMAKAVGAQHSFVNRVWQEHGLKPHLVKGFKVSNDPKFEEKIHDVVGLYLAPPERTIVLSVDEKSSIQALDRTQPGLPLKKGRCGTMTHDYKRHGTSTLFSALDIASGKVIGQCLKRHRHQEFIKFLETIDANTDKKLDLHIVIDNYSTHKHENVKNWLKKHPRFHFHFIPTSSSWLNLVERFFGLITDKQIRRGVFRSVEELEKAIMTFIECHNKDPKPFAWTKTAEDIINKIRRARDSLNE